MATVRRFIITSQGGGRMGATYYADLEAAVAEAESLNAGVSVPEQGGYVVQEVFVGDWPHT